MAINSNIFKVLAFISKGVILHFVLQIHLNRLSLTHGLFQFSSAQFSRSVASDCWPPHGTPWSAGLQHSRPPCPWPTPGVYSNSCLSSRWCHPTISSSVVPFSSCLQSFPESGSFQMSQLFISGGQSIYHSMNFHRTMFQLKKTKYILLFTFINFCWGINWYNFLLNSLAICIKNSQKTYFFDLVISLLRILRVS